MYRKIEFWLSTRKSNDRAFALYCAHNYTFMTELLSSCFYYSFYLRPSASNLIEIVWCDAGGAYSDANCNCIVVFDCCNLKGSWRISKKEMPRFESFISWSIIQWIPKKSHRRDVTKMNDNRHNSKHWVTSRLFRAKREPLHELFLACSTHNRSHSTSLTALTGFKR